MADQTSNHTNSQSSGVLAFIVGALVVAVGVIAYVLFGGAMEGDSASSGPSIEINTQADSAAGAEAADDGAAASAGAESSDAEAAATAGASAGN